METKLFPKFLFSIHIQGVLSPTIKAPIIGLHYYTIEIFFVALIRMHNEGYTNNIRITVEIFHCYSSICLCILHCALFYSSCTLYSSSTNVVIYHQSILSPFFVLHVFIKTSDTFSCCSSIVGESSGRVRGYVWGV